MADGAPLTKLALHGEALPPDALVRQYHARESLSALYEVTVDFSTADKAFAVGTCLRQRALLEIVNDNGQVRLLDGIVDQARFLRAETDRLQFQVRLRPALVMLEHREDCRIFQDSSVPDVIGKLLEEAGLDKRVEWHLTGNYPAREFVVQYNESAFAFLSRLMEDEGIFYFFTHSAEGHTLVLADNSEVFADQPDPVHLALSQSQGFREPVRGLTRRRQLRTTSVSLRDFDFKSPQVKPEASLPAQDRWSLPYYEYPAGFTEPDQAAQRATARIRQLRADADTCSGSSSALGLRPGGRFSVDDALEPELQGEFVVVSLISEGKLEFAAEAANFACRNAFEAIPLGAPYAPAQRTPRPRIAGLQTALVMGPQNEDQGIHVDEYGRIKVRFHWDRLGQYDDQASCWLRVCQVPMGGAMVLPRIGWEVSVCFLEGNPDRPLVVGRVYNAQNAPPMALPAGRATSSLKSMSSPGSAGSQEITLGDSGGAQGFAIKAQKDLNMSTGYDCSEEIKVDDERQIGKSTARSCKNDTVQIAGNQSVNVGAHLSHKITGTQSVSVGGNDTSNATGNFLEKVNGDYSYNIGGSRFTVNNGEQRTISGALTRKVGAAQLVVTADSLSDNVLGPSTIAAGAVRAHLVKGKHSESTSAPRTQTTAAVEAHFVKGDFTSSSDGITSSLVGGVHMQKISGDFVVKAPLISVLGGVGNFKGGGSELKLSGAPITVKGSKISVKAGIITKTGVGLKLA